MYKRQEYDVLVCFNPASLKVNLKNVKQGGIIVVDSSNFTTRSIETAGYTSNPLEDNSLSNYTVLQIPASEMVININSDLDKKNAERTKNMFILGLLYNMFSFDLKPAINYINNKFKNKSQLIEANLKSLEHGYKSVSYTHLRAHETVLDLVCRLLLEKKKEKHSVQYIADTLSAYTDTITHYT